MLVRAAVESDKSEERMATIIIVKRTLATSAAALASSSDAKAMPPSVLIGASGAPEPRLGAAAAACWFSDSCWASAASLALCLYILLID